MSRLRIGVVFPQTEIGRDPGVMRRFARTVESLGYDHLLAYEHVLGVEPGRPGRWKYTNADTFQEPFVLFGHLAAITDRLELVPAVIALPQRQTALVAKQAATVDVLSGGRLRLGVGLGWNRPEIESLGGDFRVRGRRIEEQIALLRRLWSEDIVELRGRWDSIDRLGINPRPSRPIPIWMGGRAEAAMRRVGRLADGWFIRTLPVPLEECRQLVKTMRGYVAEAGRDEGRFGLEMGVHAAEGGPRDWADLSHELAGIGVTHLNFGTVDAGYATPDQHLDAIARFRDAVPDLFEPRSVDENVELASGTRSYTARP